MKKILTILFLLPFLAIAQKPDYVRTPNGPNTITDWNLKAKTFIAPHGPTLGIFYGSQDTTGQLFVHVGGGDTSLYFRVGGIGWYNASKTQSPYTNGYGLNLSGYQFSVDTTSSGGILSKGRFDASISNYLRLTGSDQTITQTPIFSGGFNFSSTVQSSDGTGSLGFYNASNSAPSIGIRNSANTQSLALLTNNMTIYDSSVFAGSTGYGMNGTSVSYSNDGGGTVGTQFIHWASSQPTPGVRTDIYFPNESGTIALISDVSSSYLSLAGTNQAVTQVPTFTNGANFNASTYFGEIISGSGANTGIISGYSFFGGKNTLLSLPTGGAYLQSNGAFTITANYGDNTSPSTPGPNSNSFAFNLNNIKNGSGKYAFFVPDSNAMVGYGLNESGGTLHADNTIIVPYTGATTNLNVGSNSIYAATFGAPTYYFTNANQYIDGSGTNLYFTNRSTTGEFEFSGNPSNTPYLYVGLGYGGTQYNESPIELKADVAPVNPTDVVRLTDLSSLVTGVSSVTPGYGLTPQSSLTGAVSFKADSTILQTVTNFFPKADPRYLKISTAASTYVPLSSVGAVNGVAGLDGGGKVPLSQLPANLLQYLGQWNPSTNTPTLTNGTGATGDVYEASTAGTVNLGAGNITFTQGDFIIYNGTQWQLSAGVDRVTSVNGQQGVVVLSNLTPGYGLSGTATNLTNPYTWAVDTATVQTVSNFFPKADMRYLKSSTAASTYVAYTGSNIELNGGDIGLNGVGNIQVANEGNTAGIEGGDFFINNSSGRLATFYGGSTVYANGGGGSTSLQPTTSSLTTGVTIYLPDKTGTLSTTTDNISEFTNDAGYLTASSANTLTNKTLSGSANTLTNIPNAALISSTISGVSLGSNLATLNQGAGIASFSYTGAAAASVAIDQSSAFTPSFAGVFTFSPTASGGSGAQDYGIKFTPVGSAASSEAFTGIFYNQTGTFGSGTQRLIDLQNGGTSEFNVTSNGNLFANGGFSTNSNGSIANFFANGASGNANATTTSTQLFGGASTVLLRVSVGGQATATMASAGEDYAAFVVNSAGVGTFTSGTHPWIASEVINKPTITNNGATVTNAANLYVNTAPAGATNTYGIYSVGSIGLPHIVGNSAAPTIAAGAAAGSSPTVSISGTDLSGTITITTGTSPATGTLATITFNTAYSSAPHLGGNPAAKNAATAALGGTSNCYYTTTTATLVLNSGSVALAPSTTYVWDYTLTQ